MRYRVLVVLLLISTCFCVAVAYSAQTPTQSIAVPQGDVSQFTILASLAMGFVTTITLQVFRIFDERRKRRYDLEDRAFARKQAKNDTLQAAYELAKLSEKTRNALFRAIEENTIITIKGAEAATAAYEHANSANEKIAKLTKAETADEVTLEDIAKVGDDTNTKVTELKTQADEAARKKGE